MSEIQPKTFLIKWNKTRRFGVEFEFNNFVENSVDRTQRAVKEVIDRTGQFSEIRPWEHTIDNFDLWVVKTDSSCGIEVVTPPISGPNALKNIGQVIDGLAEIKARYNERCGLHVHVDLSDFEFNQMCILLMYWIKIETVIMNAHPAHRRNNQYCRPLNDNIPNWQQDHPYTCNEVYRAFNRYRGALNTGYWESRKTLEWRMGDMSLDSEDVKNRVRFLLWFVDIAKIMPQPENLNWFSSKQTMSFLGLLGSNNPKIKKIFSPAIHSMKAWILNRLEQNLPQDYYGSDRQLVKEMINTEL